MIILTLLTSTEIQLTQAGFKLAPSGTWSVAMPVELSCRWELCAQSFDPIEVRTGLNLILGFREECFYVA